MKHWLMATAALAVLVGPGLSEAVSVVYDGGAPDQRNGAEDTHWVEAQDFVLQQDAWITDAHFWTGELEPTTWDETLDYYFFADAGGSPAAAPFASGSGANVQKTATGNTLDNTNFHEYEYSFDLEAPLLLAAGTRYWFGLHQAADFPSFANRDDVYWETRSNNSLTHYASELGTFDNWTEHQNALAFYLTGNPAAVPEPGTVTLFGLGLGALGLGLRGRRKLS